jgi:hypothetical protein
MSLFKLNSDLIFKHILINKDAVYSRRGLVIYPCREVSPYVNRRFGVMYYLHVQARKSAEQESVLHVATLAT